MQQSHGLCATAKLGFISFTILIISLVWHMGEVEARVEAR